MQRQLATLRLARRGFNLIEAAIVLGVIGLVIGGIWVAAQAVNRELRMKGAAEDVLLIARNAVALFPRGAYPASPPPTPSQNVVSASLNAGVIPSGYVVITGPGQTRARSPSGVVINVRLECFSNGCPRLAINIYGESNTPSSEFTGADCQVFVRRLNGLLRDNTLMHRIQVKANDGTTDVWNSGFPLNMDTFSCPDDFDRVALGFTDPD
jgi:type II secretory pathway pseudopilin PulG